MAENTEQTQEQVQEEQQQERQYTEQELKAMAHGWTPKDQWDGPEDEWIPAKIFNDRGDLFGRIANDKKEISALKTTVKELVEHSKKTYDNGFQAGLKELRAQRKEAIENGDAEKAFEIDDQIDQFKEEHAQKKQQFEERVTPQQQQNTNPMFDTWHAENDWYLKDGSLTAYANDLMIEMTEQARVAGKQVDYPKALQEITRKTKSKFPEKFGRTQRAAPAAVDTGSGGTGSGAPRESTASTKDMTDQERTIMRSIMKSTGMSQADYMKEYHKYTERKG